MDDRLRDIANNNKVQWQKWKFITTLYNPVGRSPYSYLYTFRSRRLFDGLQEPSSAHRFLFFACVRASLDECRVLGVRTPLQKCQPICLLSKLYPSLA